MNTTVNNSKSLDIDKNYSVLLDEDDQCRFVLSNEDYTSPSQNITIQHTHNRISKTNNLAIVSVLLFIIIGIMTFIVLAVLLAKYTITGKGNIILISFSIFILLMFLSSLLLGFSIYYIIRSSERINNMYANLINYKLDYYNDVDNKRKLFNNFKESSIAEIQQKQSDLDKNKSTVFSNIERNNYISSLIHNKTQSFNDGLMKFKNERKAFFEKVISITQINESLSHNYTLLEEGLASKPQPGEKGSIADIKSNIEILQNHLDEALSGMYKSAKESRDMILRLDSV